jgi:hypothetical protein
LETSRIPHFLDSGLTDSGEVVSLTRWKPFNPRKNLGSHFCYRLSHPRGTWSGWKKLGKFKYPITLSGIEYITIRLVA